MRINELGKDEGGATIVDFDPFSTEALTDPYPWYKALRPFGSIVKLDRYNSWGAFGYDAVNDILRDHEVFSSEAGIGLTNLKHGKPWRPPSLILEKDPPFHTRTRGVLNKTLSPPNIKKMQDYFREQAEILIEQLVEQGSFDAVKDLAEPYPANVFPDVLGLPEQGRDHLLIYGNLNFNAIYDTGEHFLENQKQAGDTVQYITALCARESLDPDGIAAQIYSHSDQGEITEQEAALLVRSFLSAGVDTTVTGLGQGIHAFTQFPDQWDFLLQNPDKIRGALNEILRWGGAVVQFFRTTTKETEIAGVTIPDDQKILVCYSAANHDPEKWQNPELFDLQRDSTGHLAFGAGVHACVGQMVARLETECIFSALAKRVKRIELDGEAVIRVNNSLRGYESLPVRVIPL